MARSLSVGLALSQALSLYKKQWEVLLCASIVATGLSTGIAAILWHERYAVFTENVSTLKQVHDQSNGLEQLRERLQGIMTHFGQNLWKFLLEMVIFGLIMALLHVYIVMGQIKLGYQIVKKGNAPFSTLFISVQEYLSALGISILNLLYLILIGSLIIAFCLVKGSLLFMWSIKIPLLVLIVVLAYYYLGLTFTYYALADKSKGPLAALTDSMEAVDGHRLKLVLFFIAVGLISGLGMALSGSVSWAWLRLGFASRPVLNMLPMVILHCVRLVLAPFAVLAFGSAYQQIK